MTSKKIIFLFCVFACISACKPVCDPGSVTTLLPPHPTKDPMSFTPSMELTEVEIKGKLKEVNRVIHGPICNDSWERVVYVACDVQVAAWEEDPTFLRECDLNIAEDAVIYVASHNDAKYVEGCSCHE